MEFIELHRHFVPIGKTQEPSLDIGSIWGRRIGGWLEWSDLLQYRRVILLAEASSGKTQEFLHQAKTLFDEGKPACSLCIEELADGSLEDALDPKADEAFRSWHNGNGAGWFFLDSIDEARLNQRNFERALKRFARGLGDHSLGRARIYISCRVSDWKGDEDKAVITRCLPAWEVPGPQPEEDEHRALLAPIFDSRQERTSLPTQEPEHKPTELLVVQLIPLLDEQRHAFASAAGLQDVDSFIEGNRSAWP